MQSDSAFTYQCSEMAHLLRELCAGDSSSIPNNYLDYFHHTFVDGDISLVPAISKVTESQELSIEEFQEVVELLTKVNPEFWPTPSSILAIDPLELVEEDELEFPQTADFVEDNLSTAEKVEKVLKTVIESVFKGKVSNIRDLKGKFPSDRNNFLQESDGTFVGTFNHEKLVFHFEIAPTELGWICTYRLEESSLDGLPRTLKEEKRDGKTFDTRSSSRTKGWR